jgi:hypothetical protein
LVEELCGLHRRPRLLAPFIGHAAIAIRERTESGKFRRLQSIWRSALVSGKVL